MSRMSQLLSLFTPAMLRGVLRSAATFLLALFLTGVTGCASRPGGWGFASGQGTIDRQKARAAVHDPYPLNDIGPEVVGGRPREYFTPRSEPAREDDVPLQYRRGY